jgi:hypothetical protein
MDARDAVIEKTRSTFGGVNIHITLEPEWVEKPA